MPKWENYLKKKMHDSVLMHVKVIKQPFRNTITKTNHKTRHKQVRNLYINS